MLQSPSGLNVVTDSLPCLSASHIFRHTHHSPVPLPLFVIFLAFSFHVCSFRSSQSYPAFSLLSQFPAFHSPASFCSVDREGRERHGSTSCLYMPQCTATPPVSLLVHISVWVPVHLHDCLFTFIFSCVVCLFMFVTPLYIDIVAIVVFI